MLTEVTTLRTLLFVLAGLSVVFAGCIKRQYYHSFEDNRSDSPGHPRSPPRDPPPTNRKRGNDGAGDGARDGTIAEIDLLAPFGDR